jgi:hypothetical protein
MRSVPYRGETRTSRAAAHEAWMLCADEVIGNQGTSGDGTFRTWHDVRLESVMRFKADIGESNIAACSR